MVLSQSVSQSVSRQPLALSLTSFQTFRRLPLQTSGPDRNVLVVGCSSGGDDDDDANSSVDVHSHTSELPSKRN